MKELGFAKILFPIIIVDGTDIDIVYTLEDFALDPDIFFWSFDDHMELLDSNGNIWSWKYDHENKTNLPGEFKRTVDIDGIRDLINTYFKNTKVRGKVKKLTEDATSISALIESVADLL